jgi:hypothetical protein
VLSVEAFSFSFGQLLQFGSYNLQASVFETGNDLADNVLATASGLMMEKVR